MSDKLLAEAIDFLKSTFDNLKLIYVFGSYSNDSNKPNSDS